MRTVVVDRSEDAMFTSLIVALDFDVDVERMLDVVEALVLRLAGCCGPRVGVRPSRVGIRCCGAVDGSRT